MRELDIEFLRLIHYNRLIFLDDFWYGVSFLNTYFNLGLILFLFVMSSLNQSKALRLRAVILGIGMFFSMLLSLGLKHIFQRPRPFHSYKDIASLSEAGSFSFPSGHTLEAVIVATLVWSLFPNGILRWWCVCWAFMVAYSRMALGVHYPGDVLGGLVTGVLAGRVLANIARKRFFLSQ